MRGWQRINLSLPLEIRCRGVINQRNAVNLETICNHLGIRSLKKLKGALGRIALIGSYRIWLARNSQEWSSGELIRVKAWNSHTFHTLVFICICISLITMIFDSLIYWYRSLGVYNIPGNTPLFGLMCGWLCWKVMIPWKCIQLFIYLYSLISLLNKELFSFFLLHAKMKSMGKV